VKWRKIYVTQINFAKYITTLAAHVCDHPFARPSRGESEIPDGEATVPLSQRHQDRHDHGHHSQRKDYATTITNST
jgi:hypothetical protein